MSRKSSRQHQQHLLYSGKRESSLKQGTKRNKKRVQLILKVNSVGRFESKEEREREKREKSNQPDDGDELVK